MPFCHSWKSRKEGQGGRRKIEVGIKVGREKTTDKEIEGRTTKHGLGN